MLAPVQKPPMQQACNLAKAALLAPTSKSSAKVSSWRRQEYQSSGKPWRNSISGLPRPPPVVTVWNLQRPSAPVMMLMTEQNVHSTCVNMRSSAHTP